MLYRLANPRWEINGGARVRLAENLRKCVVYLGIRAAPGSETEIASIGTGFMVSLCEAGGSYLVTANHVARALGPSFVVRFNDKNGAGRNHQIDNPKWECQPSTDLAVLELDAPDWADCVHVPRHRFLTEQLMEDQDIGAGDLAHIVGAFRLLHGEHKNLPLVHTGHVALLPEDEPIHIKGIGEIRGYLVQAQTLRGASGAPVFVRRHVPGYVKLDRSPDAEGWMYGESWLLGVNHGAWFGKPEDVFELPSGPVEVPVSMAVVIPVQRLIEMLDSDKMKKRRKRAADKENAWRRASPTSAKTPLSLHPLPLETALSAALQTGRAPDQKRKKSGG